MARSLREYIKRQNRSLDVVKRMKTCGDEGRLKRHEMIDGTP